MIDSTFSAGTSSRELRFAPVEGTSEKLGKMRD